MLEAFCMKAPGREVLSNAAAGWPIGQNRSPVGYLQFPNHAWINSQTAVRAVASSPDHLGSVDTISVSSLEGFGPDGT